LAGALRDERSRDRRDKIARQAVELARRTGNPAALAYALDGRAAAIIAPDTAAECLALGSELRDLGATIGDPDRVLQGHYHRIIVLVLTGDVAGAESDLNAVSRIAGELRQPVELWRLSATQAMFALAAGRLEDADELIGRAFSLGERAQPEMAIPVHGLQRHALGQCRGDLEEVEPAIHNLAAAYPARPVFRCVLAHLQAELDQLADAERTLHELARDGFSVLPFDMEWLFAMSLLVETCALLGATEHAPALYDLLAPWASFNASNFLEGIRGSVARYLGTLAWMLERWDDAARHFHYALEMNERMGARPWLAHTQRDYGRMLVERGETKRASELVASALATYRELGMERYAARM
jgi:tetratricopeptide (TPR) repeat protein